MALVEFTSYDEVRAALGVSDDELEDSTISLSIYEFDLKKELRGVSTDLLSSYAAILSLDEASRTALQVNLYEAVRLFSTYAVARHLATTLPIFSPKEMTDSKSSFVRYAQGGVELTMAGIEQRYTSYKTGLEAAYEAVNSAAPATKVTRVYAVTAGLSVDPVTGS